MSTGLVLKRGLNRWECEARAHKATVPLGAVASSAHVMHALVHFLQLAATLKLKPEWVVGEGLTKGACRGLGLALRQRAPGGGPKGLPPGTQRKRATFWLSPAGILAIKQAAAKSGVTMGEEIEARFLSDNS